MTVETSQDRLTVLNDFGVDVTIGSSKIKAIFDNPHQDITIGGEVPFSIQECSITARTADLTSVGQGSILVIDSVNYAVTDIQPDGTGMTMVMLERQ